MCVCEVGIFVCLFKVTFDTELMKVSVIHKSIDGGLQVPRVLHILLGTLLPPWCNARAGADILVLVLCCLVSASSPSPAGSPRSPGVLATSLCFQLSVLVARRVCTRAVLVCFSLGFFALIFPFSDKKSWCRYRLALK